MNKSDLEYDEDEERDLVADTDKLMSFQLAPYGKSEGPKGYSTDQE